MKKNLYFLVPVMLIFILQVQAQDTSPDTSPKRYAASQKKYTFAFQPMQWFNWAWRFDFEMRLGDGPGWLQFGPAVYSIIKEIDSPHYLYEGKNYSTDHWHLREPFSKLRGGGLDVNYKRFLDPKRSCYVASGLSYTRLEIDYWGRIWESYTEDGLAYYSPKLGYHTRHLNRLGINALFGYQIPNRHAFLFDVFTGVTYRHSFAEKDKPSFNNHEISYGYTGFVFQLGIRLGFGIR